MKLLTCRKSLSVFLISLFSFTTLLFAFPKLAAAATYYVTTTGSDSNNGSQATPWLTLNKAETAASDGDTVYVAAGTYVENDASTFGWKTAKAISWIAQGEVIVKGTGSSIRPLYISGTGAATYNGFTIDGEGTRTYAVFMASGTQNKTFINCTFKGATSTTFNMVGSNHSITGSTFTTTAGDSLIVNTFDNITIDDNTFTVTGTRVFRTTAAGGTFSFTNNTVNATATTVMFIPSHNGTYTFTGNTITTTGTTALIFDTSASTGTIVFSNNTVNMNHQVTAQGIRILQGTWDVTINNNTITSTNLSQANNIIYIRNQDSPNIENNTIESYSTSSVPQIEVQSTGTAGGTTVIKNNTLKSRSTSGYIIAVGSEGTTAGDNKLDGAVIEGNTLYGALYYDPTLTLVSTHSIFFSYNKNAEIRYNTVYGGGYGVVIKGGGMTWTGGGVYYNKFINSNSTTSVRIKGVRNLPVYNNTIYTASSYPNPFGLVYITANGTGETSTGTILKNNIIFGGGDNALIRIESGSETGLTSTNNLWYRHPGSGNNIGTIGSTSYDWGQWLRLGYDSNSINVNPKFKDASSYNFLLEDSSEAINHGMDVGLTRDFAGTALPQETYPDIGAYEIVRTFLPAVPTPAAPVCTLGKPTGEPKLYQINTTKKSATLYFAPASGNVSSYTIAYGYTQGDERFGTTFSYGKTDAAISHTINDLEPNKTYYFKVRASNDCRPGDWSNSLKGTTLSTSNASATTSGLAIFTAWAQMLELVLSWLP